MKNIYIKLINNIGAVILIAILGLVLLGTTYVNLGPTSNVDGDIGVTAGHGYYIDDVLLTYSDVDAQQADAALTSISGLTYVSPSFIKLTADDTYAVRTLTEVKTDLSLNNVTNDAQIAKSIGTAQGDLIYFTASATPTVLAKGTATQVLAMNAGATAPEWVAAGGGGGYTNLTSFVDQTAWRLFYSNTSGDVTELALGADGTYLKSNGAAAAPTFATPAGGGGGYTNLTSFVDQTAWRLFYSNTSGDVTELALGADGTYLKSNGAAAAPTFATPAGGGDALTANPLSQFAATSSAELRGVLSDEIGAGKARFDTSVTAKTTTATLTVAEAGTILCSAAGGAYTITLPTASGNTGLQYHFIKTDANYTLITLDGNGAETLNYENATSAPVATYARLNTYCAEVTIVSDGSNWQVIDEAMGQVPEAYSYLNAEQSNITGNTWVKVTQNVELFDIGSNFDTANSKFVCPIAGKYQILTGVTWKVNDFVQDKEYKMALYKNGTGNLYTSNSASLAVFLPNNINFIGSYTVNDYIEMFVKYVDAASTQDITPGSGNTYMIIRLVSKD